MNRTSEGHYDSNTRIVVNVALFPNATDPMLVLVPEICQGSSTRVNWDVTSAKHVNYIHELNETYYARVNDGLGLFFSWQHWQQSIFYLYG